MKFVKRLNILVIIFSLIFIVSSSSANATTFIVAANNSLHQHTADFICDGIDDQVEIQAAIDALPIINRYKSGKIVLLEGTFYISATIQIHGSLMIEGMGIDTTYWKLAANANCDMFSDSEMSANMLFFSMKEMKLDGVKDNNNAGIGINLGSGSHYIKDVHLDHLWVNKFSEDGIKIQRSGWGYLFENMIIEYNKGNGITITNTGNSSDFKLYFSKIIANDGHGIELEDPSLH